MNIQPYFEILGKPVKDRVTGAMGVATSLSFDLYGCVQVLITPPNSDNEDKKKSYFYDYSRCIATSEERVMPVPDYGAPRAERLSSGVAAGPAEKPAMD